MQPPATTQIPTVSRNAPSSAHWRQNAYLWHTAAAAIICLVLTLASWFAVSDQARREATLEFDSAAKSHAIAVQNGIREYIADMDALSTLFESSDHAVSRNEFEHFAKRILQSQAAMVSVGWVPRIRRDQRAQHEAEAANQGLAVYTIKITGPDGSLSASPQQDEYFPLYYRVAKDGSAMTDAFDGSDQAAEYTKGRAVLEQARESGRVAVSEDAKLAIGGQGFFSMTPVYMKDLPHETMEDRRNNLIGFIRGSFRTAVMFETILNTNSTPAGLDVYFFNAGSAADAPPILYHASRLRAVPAEALPRAQVEAGLHWSTDILIGNRKFTMLAAPIAGGVGTPATAGAWIALLIGLLISGIVTAYFWSSGNNAQRLHDANAQLDMQNLRFDAALNNMSQGLIMFDATGHIVVCNNRYFEIYEASREIVKPGCSLREHLAHLAQKGYLRKEDLDQYEARIRAEVAMGKHTEYVNTTADGRKILSSKVPMASGGWVVTFEDITERKQAEAKIAYMALHDGLTNLPNRLSFHQEIENRLAHLSRDQKFAVLCLDLDQFKAVNDTLGHPCGDKLLCQVSERLRNCLREGDVVARLGGDEFAILQENLSELSEITSMMTRLIEAIARPFDLDGHQVMIGVSIGVALAPGDGTRSDQLLKNADMALYRAKLDGRGIYRFFEPEMDARMQARRRLEQDLRRAIVNGEFELYYQPLMSLEAERICGFEALIRWHHPERGMVSPADFIPLAEETALIVPIGEWVLRQACAEAAKWPDDISVAVNLSPAQFKAQNLSQTIINALARSGLAARRLELEITESVLLVNNEPTLAVLHQLRALGVRISMDDFGTGYSSLSYLRSFPFDKIKIDQSFVRNVSVNEDDKAIIRAVTGLGASLKMTTTAEGVETQAELDYLKSEGCKEAQGYFFSKPLPASELNALLNAQTAKLRAVG